MITRHAWLLALATLLVVSGTRAQEALPAPATPEPAPAPAPPATPPSEPVPPAPAPVVLAPEPAAPVLEPATPAPEPAAPAPEPATPADLPGPKVVWQGRVMTGFELEKSRPSAEQSGERVTDYGFFVDQARLSLEAEWDDLSIDISGDLADAIRPKTSSAAFNKPPYLRNAYLNYRVHKAFRIRAGRFKRPMSALEMTSSGDLPFRGRGLANELILEDGQWGDRAIGLMLYGRLPAKLRWHVSATNPSWAPDGDIESNGIDAIARLEWEAADILELGLSFGHKLEVRAEREYQGNAASFDAALNVAGLRVALDAVLGQLTNQASDEFDAPLAYGVVGYATYQIPLAGEFALEPVLLGEYADSDSELSRTEALRTVIGCNLRLADRLRVMPQVEIVRPLGTAAQINPWLSSETYYLMMTAQL